MMTKVWNTLTKTSQLWKAALASGVAWEVAQWTGSERPYFAPLAAILCLQVTVEESIWRGYQRVLGIVVGVFIASVIVRSIGLHGWSIALVVLVGTSLATWLKFGSQAIPQVGVSAMMVLTVGTHQATYGFERVVDTVIGAVISVLINMLVIPPDYTPQAEASLGEAGRVLADRFDRITGWLHDGANREEGRRLQDETRAYLERLHKTEDRVERAIHAVKYSPLVQKRHRYLVSLERELLRLRQGYAHAAGVVRTLLEWMEVENIGASERVKWAGRVEVVAQAIREWRPARGYGATGDKYAGTGESSLGTVPDWADQEDEFGCEGMRFQFALLNDLQQALHDFV